MRTFVSHLSTCGYGDKGSYLWCNGKTGFVIPQSSFFWSKLAATKDELGISDSMVIVTSNFDLLKALWPFQHLVCWCYAHYTYRCIVYFGNDSDNKSTKIHFWLDFGVNAKMWYKIWPHSIEKLISQTLSRLSVWRKIEVKKFVKLNCKDMNVEDAVKCIIVIILLLSRLFCFIANDVYNDRPAWVIW